METQFQQESIQEKSITAFVIIAVSILAIAVIIGIVLTNTGAKSATMTDQQSLHLAKSIESHIVENPSGEFPGSQLIHSGRKARCNDCQVTFDRDYNAAMNLASQRHLTLNYPNSDNNGLVGDNCSPLGQVIDPIGHSSNTKQQWKKQETQTIKIQQSL